ncbi:hypothetical protein FHS27_006471 [Rhodopirellula rubra]|uniref:Uncharacterized protein n=1 Tax=Aporhodopirellula rubra TaxID=980271 RepID=A0A7W5H9J9_9BACT|nr:hypothetical protein [Aporhodopirellula rubra]MBB3210623.1 hypothetical protein [Aporhodopirellula rubra]
MSREFHIGGNAFAIAEFSTAASWHLNLLARTEGFPNVASVIGTIDVHYPCLTSRDGQPPVFRATVVLDAESLDPTDTKPTRDQIDVALRREFEISDNADWSLGHYECAEGHEDEFDSGAYH